MKSGLVVLAIAFAAIAMFVFWWAAQAAWLSATPVSDPEFYRQEYLWRWHVTLGLIVASLACVLIRVWIGRRHNR